MNDDVLADFAASRSRDIGLLLDVAARAINSAVLRGVAERGHPNVRPSHVPVFAGLSDGGTRISTLAAKSGVSRQAMGVTVREVEALGYVRTRADPEDARATLVELTDSGVDFCRIAISVSDRINRELETALGEARADQLRDQLRRIAYFE